MRRKKPAEVIQNDIIDNKFFDLHDKTYTLMTASKSKAMDVIRQWHISV